MFRLTALVIILLVVGSAVAAPTHQAMIINADRADYNGNKVVLTGNVYVEHEFGELSCDMGVFIQNNSSARRPFSFLRLVDHVNLRMWDGGLLRCARADFDYNTLSGTFSGSQAQQYVTYVDSYSDKNGENMPLVLKGRRMTVKLDENLSDAHKTFRHRLVNVVVEEQVTVEYGRRFTAAADRVIYQRTGSEWVVKDSQLQGLIYLQPRGRRGTCQISSEFGDLIKAKQIRIDMIRRQLRFDAPEGVIHLVRTLEKGADADNELHFSCQRLLWDESTNKLTLRGDVVVDQGGIGTLKAADEVEFLQKEIDGKHQLQWVVSKGKTTLSYTDKLTGKTHLLTCYGQMLIDHVHLLASMEKGGDESNQGRQVLFHDEMGEISADKIYLHYTVENGEVVPQKLTVLGNVKIINRDQQEIVQYALADSAEYFPEKEEVKLLSGEGKRVLLYDKKNQIQVSAEAVNMFRDKNGKESFRGVGDVRFTFHKEELLKLKQQFQSEGL